ncbi:transcriptional regulator, LysR family [Variovorax sp. CF079]|uniref:LysR family transcriptional regulator n=1 Tax=Variovorax sp. CF079 TaxID=1882774 RepID=UPI000891B89C|nr:LysR family transcriptional regulator [Variovorax sp. CF079]SDC82522.1 transcriptional regulator, LysR family [Variovorax sp. CF079]
MNFLWLEDFLALAATGNFSRAAEERHMTQPAFSRRIRALEEWLGVVLVDRTSHPATLTEAGEWFRSSAQELLARVARMPDEARAVADASSATLRIASTHALSLTFMPAWLRGLESGASAGPMQLVSDVMQQCEALMLQGRTQFLLCHGHAQVPGRLEAGGFPSCVVGADALIPVCAPGKRNTPVHALRGTDSARVPMLAYSTESGLGRIMRAVLGARLEQLATNVVLTAHLATVLKTMALEARGIAWLPVSLIQTELAEGTLLPVGDGKWNVELEIRLFRTPGQLPRAAEVFWRAAMQSARRV